MNPEILASLNIGAVFRNSEHSCVGMCFSRDGSALGVGFEDGTVTVIDPDEAKLIRTHRSHKYGLSKFTFLNQDPRGVLAVAVGCPEILEDYSIRVWDLVQNRFCRVLKHHDALIDTISPHPGKDVLVSSSMDGTTCMWDVREEKPVWQCSEQGASISAFDKAEGSNIFVVTSPSTKSICFFDMRQFGSPLNQLAKFPNPMEEIVFSSDGSKLLVSSGRLGAVSTISVESVSVKSTYFLQPSKRKYNLCTSACSTFGMASTVANNLDIWNIDSRVKVRSLTGHDGPPIGLFSPRHALVASASMPVALWAPFS